MGVDCVSGGELYTARRAGFPASRIYFHGNNKTDRDIRDALEMGVGTFVADNREELDALERLAADAGRVQSILLRITPGIDPHTHKAISTGRVDSKFGSAIETGQALDITRYALGLPHIALRGFHCHIGSQIFDRYPFVDAARIMIDFMASVRTATGFVAHELNRAGAGRPLYGIRPHCGLCRRHPGYGQRNARHLPRAGLSPAARHSGAGALSGRGGRHHPVHSRIRQDDSRFPHLCIGGRRNAG